MIIPEKNFDMALYVDLSQAIEAHLSTVHPEETTSEGTLLVDANKLRLKTIPVQSEGLVISALKGRLCGPEGPRLVKCSVREKYAGETLKFEPLIDHYVDRFSKVPRLRMVEHLVEADAVELLQPFTATGTGKFETETLPSSIKVRALSTHYLLDAGVDGEYRNYSHRLSANVLALGEDITAPDTIYVSSRDTAATLEYERERTRVFLAEHDLTNPFGFNSYSKDTSHADAVMRFSLGLIAVAAVTL